MYVGARRTDCFVAFICAIFHATFAQRCPNGAPSTFTKISSMVPRTTVPPILLFASATPGTAVTAECYNRCRRSDDCAGFIVDYHRASCFRVSAADMSLPDQVSLVPERSSNFFLKTCVQVPVNCTQKVWAFEYSPNSELIGYQQHVIPNVADQWQCAQLCLNGAKQYRYGQNAPCYSAQYQHWSKTCTLSSETRRTKPEAFNPIVQEGVDYIENLCLTDTSPNNVGCWHEPVYNYTLEHIDLQIPDLNLEQCRERCETEQSFACRGFTHRCQTNPNYGLETVCYLHSDDTLTAGPLIYRPCTTYVERLTCIDLKVECSVNKMVLTLHYTGFSGRMFAVGYADECGIDGNNHDVTTLVLPITNDPRAPNPCGIVVAHSVGYGNRKLATAIIAIQRHPIIQTLGDRIAKVTCIAEEPSDRLPRPLFKNITLDATFGVAEPPVQTSIVNEIANISSVSPTARLRILDLSRGGTEASETLLGEELELRVDIYPPFNTSMLRAGHLVASSGDGRDSFLLLDWRGCPPDPSTFPALTPKGSTVLSAIFKAFRFPSSPILKFSLILTICDGICQPTDCGNGLTSWGRRKKRAVAAAAANDDLNKQEVPLQLAIIVRSPEPEEVYNSTEMISLYSIPDSDSEESPCVSWSAMMTAMLIFGITQIVLLAFCTVIYYRKKSLFNDQVKLNNDFHPRHVKWADQ